MFHPKTKSKDGFGQSETWFDLVLDENNWCSSGFRHSMCLNSINWIDITRWRLEFHTKKGWKMLVKVFRIARVSGKKSNVRLKTMNRRSADILYDFVCAFFFFVLFCYFIISNDGNVVPRWVPSECDFSLTFSQCIPVIKFHISSAHDLIMTLHFFTSRLKIHWEMCNEAENEKTPIPLY